MSSTPIKVGIAGLGRSGWNIHAEAFRTLPEMYSVSGVFDPDEERRRDAVDDLGATAHASFESLITDEKLEVIVVATPSSFHVDHSLSALNAGKHVVCEKPMAVSLEDAERMVDKASTASATYTVFQNKRFEPDFIKVKELIDSGILGDVKLINMRGSGFKRRWDWQTLKKLGGGVLNNTGPHLLDQAIQLIGDTDPEQVFADLQLMLASGDAEDHFKIVIKGGYGYPVVDIECSGGVAYPGDKWTVSGTLGGLRGSDSELWWKTFDPEKFPAPPVEETAAADRKYYNGQIEFEHENYWKKPEDVPTQNQLFYTAYYESLRNGTEFPIRAESVLRQMRLIAKAKEISPV